MKEIKELRFLWPLWVFLAFEVSLAIYGLINYTLLGGKESIQQGENLEVSFEKVFEIPLPSYSGGPSSRGNYYVEQNLGATVAWKLYRLEKAGEEQKFNKACQIAYDTNIDLKWRKTGCPLVLS